MKLTLTLIITSAMLAVTSQAQTISKGLGTLQALNTVRSERIASIHPRTPARHYVLLGSMAFMATGQMLDCASSIGGHETNSMIGNGKDGRFNAGRGFGIKGAIVAGIIGGEYLLHRRNGHQLDAILSGANSTYGGIGIMAAIHNYGVSK